MMRRRPIIIRLPRNMSRISILHNRHDLIPHRLTYRRRLRPQAKLPSASTQRIQQYVRPLRVSEHHHLGCRATRDIGGQLCRHGQRAGVGAVVVGKELRGVVDGFEVGVWV